MRILNTVLTVLAWIVLGIVLWAVGPLLVKLFEGAQRLHDLFK